MLHASTDKVLPKIGEPVPFNARLTLNGTPLEIETAEALVRAPDGSTQLVTLTPSGDSRTASWIPQAAGLYGINLRVAASSPEGIPVDRVAFLTVEAQPGTSPPSETDPVNSENPTFLIGGLILLVLVGIVSLAAGAAIAWLYYRKKYRQSA